MSKAAQLRNLIKEPGIIVLPGAHDVLAAKVIEQAGFPAIFTGGFSLSASTLGVPDIGLLTATENLDRVRRVVEAVSVPVVADMDTGYGNSLNVIRTVQECMRLGVAGVTLEDQLWPKKCGHMEGKIVIPMEEHVEKLKAAVYARSDGDLVVIARTDARAPLGLKEAIRRGNAYVSAGADVLFIEAPQSIEEIKTVATSFDVPLLANMIEGGKTPFLAARELAQIGFKIALYPLSSLFASARAVQDVASHLMSKGTTSGFDQMASFHEFEEIIELQRFREIESRFMETN